MRQHSQGAQPRVHKRDVGFWAANPRKMADPHTAPKKSGSPLAPAHFEPSSGPRLYHDYSKSPFLTAVLAFTACAALVQFAEATNLAPDSLSASDPSHDSVGLTKSSKVSDYKQVKTNCATGRSVMNCLVSVANYVVKTMPPSNKILPGQTQGRVDPLADKIHKETYKQATALSEKFQREIIFKLDLSYDQIEIIHTFLVLSAFAGIPDCNGMSAYAGALITSIVARGNSTLNELGNLKIRLQGETGVRIYKGNHHSTLRLTYSKKGKTQEIIIDPWNVADPYGTTGRGLVCRKSEIKAAGHDCNNGFAKGKWATGRVDFEHSLSRPKVSTKKQQENYKKIMLLIEKYLLSLSEYPKTELPVIKKLEDELLNLVETFEMEQRAESAEQVPEETEEEASDVPQLHPEL